MQHAKLLLRGLKKVDANKDERMCKVIPLSVAILLRLNGIKLIIWENTKIFNRKKNMIQEIVTKL